MKKFFKFGCLSVIVVVILAVIIGVATGGGSSTNDSSGTTSKNTTSTPKASTSKKETNKITKANFDKIKAGESLDGNGGMSIAQVEAILGKTDDSTESSSTIDGKDYKTTIMTWMDGTFNTTSITVTFTNGHVSDKTFSK